MMNYDLQPGKVKEEQREILNKDIEPVISIITPYFNSKKYIEYTANSVLNQTFPFFEWIIINDGSTDKESIEKIKEIEKMDSRIHVYHNENHGLAYTRDFGVSKSSESSKYLVFLDDDDLINRTYLECAYWTLETNKEASWTYTDTVNFKGMEYTWVKWFDSEVEKKENLLVAMSMIRKRDFLEVNGYELREKSVYEDWNLWLKMLAKDMYPVRMSFFGFWYRRKPINESELARSTNNKEVAMRYIEESARKVKNRVEAIQYPKQDYNWDGIVEKVDGIIIPKRKENGKINILMIVPWMVTGGADKFNLDLVSKLDKNKYNVIMITTEPSTNEWRQEFEEHAIIYDITKFLDRKYWNAFLNYLIESNNINIIFNTNSTFGYASLPYLKAKYPEIPIIDYIHMEEWYNRNGGFSRDSSTISSVIDKTLVCNENSEKILINHFGRNEKEVETIYIGVDENKFNPSKFNKEELLRKYNVNCNDKFIISFIARIDYQKRPFLFVNIMEQVLRNRDDVFFIIVGDGPLLEQVKQKTKKMSDNITFLGNIKETEEIYAISDLTINCSIKEGLALTSYESLSMGIPVISSNVGGQAELINNEVGKIVPCMQQEKDIHNFNYTDDEIKNYVKSIDEILNNLEYYKKNARARILKGFTINNMVDNMSNIFEYIANSPNKQKIENAKALGNYKDLTKELINKYFISSKEEYAWLCRKFNDEYIGNCYEKIVVEPTKSRKEKIRIIVVKITKKMHLYNILKKILRRGVKND